MPKWNVTNDYLFLIVNGELVQNFWCVVYIHSYPSPWVERKGKKKKNRYIGEGGRIGIGQFRVFEKRKKRKKKKKSYYSFKSWFFWFFLAQNSPAPFRTGSKPPLEAPILPTSGIKFVETLTTESMRKIDYEIEKWGKWRQLSPPSTEAERLSNLLSAVLQSILRRERRSAN